jgi:hypothetical protein
MSVAHRHRLEGFEPDNLLAFLALLGVLRSLEAIDQTQHKIDRVHPRAIWELDHPPLRPALILARAASKEDIATQVARGLERIATYHEFDRKGLNYSRRECRELLTNEANKAGLDAREKVDILAALMSDGAFKDQKKMEVVDPTPLCLLFGQGHQHFLERLANVPNQAAPTLKAKGKKDISATECMGEALFHPWHRNDDTFSFRWDPEEDVRYALMAGDPTDPAYKSGTQHGANRLAAIGLTALTVSPQRRGVRIRPHVIGGNFSAKGFSFAWPIWREPATLATVRAMLGHRDLRKPDALAHLSVEHVLEARRISVGKFMNFSRARRLAELPSERTAARDLS